MFVLEKERIVLELAKYLGLPPGYCFDSGTDEAWFDEKVMQQDQ